MQAQIILQKQKSNHDCSRTCLAMLLDTPSEVLETPYSSVLHPYSLWHTLKQSFGEVEACCALEDIVRGYVYVVSVPAIYGTGETHLVIIDTRERDFKLYDPSNTLEYTLDPSEVDNEKVFLFKGFVPLIKINASNFTDNFGKISW